MVIAAIESITVAIALFSCRHVLGYLFSNEKQVVNYVAEMIPLLCISVLMDSLQAVLSGQFPCFDRNYVAQLLGVKLAI